MARNSETKFRCSLCGEPFFTGVCGSACALCHDGVLLDDRRANGGPLRKPWTEEERRDYVRECRALEEQERQAVEQGYGRDHSLWVEKQEAQAKLLASLAEPLRAAYEAVKGKS